MDKFIQIGEKFGLEGEKLLEFVQEKLKLEEEKEEKRRKLEEKEGGKKRKRKKNVDNWKRKEKKSVGS